MLKAPLMTLLLRCRSYFSTGLFALLIRGLLAVQASSLLLAFPASAQESDEDEFRWRLSFYAGQWSDTRFVDIMRFDTDFRSSWVFVLGAARTILEITEHLELEAEVNFGQHQGRQSHQEFNLALPLRWTLFPWDRFVNTSVAYGLGYSIATRAPPIEERVQNPADPRLVYMLFEVEARLPKIPKRSLYLRIHHRSGAFDLVSPASGSNFVGLGIRAHF